MIVWSVEGCLKLLGAARSGMESAAFLAAGLSARLLKWPSRKLAPRTSSRVVARRNGALGTHH